MQVEFKKVPFSEKNFQIDYNLVNFEGTFCKMSQELVKLKAKISGKLETVCARCGKDLELQIDENIELLISDGIYESTDDELDVVETNNSVIDFDDIVQSEIESIKSDYHVCSDCINDSEPLDKEF